MSDRVLPSNPPGGGHDTGPGAAERPSARTDLPGYLSDFQNRMTRLQERAEHSQALLEAVTGIGASAGGEVTATVGAGGALTAIEFTSEVRRTSPESLAEMVMEAYGKAVARAATEATAAMTGLLGAGTPALDDFTASLRARGEGGEH